MILVECSIPLLGWRALSKFHFCSLIADLDVDFFLFIIMQASKDCVQKTLKRLEEKIHGRV